MLPTLLMAVPSTMLYFTAYDELKEHMEAGAPPGSALHAMAPLAAGGLARTAAATVVSPLELIRTKMQGPAAARLLRPATAGAGRGAGWGVLGAGVAGWRVAAAAGTGLRRALAEEVRAGGLRSLWRGVVPTLWRDVPFSMVYWLGYEQARSAAMHALTAGEGLETVSDRFLVSFLAGAASGSLAATLTAPLDVVKTRVQVQAYELQQLRRPGTAAVGGARALADTSTVAVLARIVAEEGAGALFAGLAARLAKVAPACAIMISSYEVCKQLLGERHAAP